MPYRMGDLAAEDSYSDLLDVGAPLIPSGPQFSAGVPVVNRVFDRLPAAVMGGLAEQVKLPGQMMAPNPYPPGSEEAAFYDASKTATAAKWAPGMALNMMGGGVAGTGKGGGVAVGSGPIRKTADTQPQYLRVGDWHPSETSRNYAKGDVEPGVSVYSIDPKTGRPLPTEGEWALDDLTDRMRSDAPKHIVTGERVGTGHEGEPLLKKLKIIEPWTPEWRPGKDVTLGSGATDKKMGAILAATDNQSGIRAYHSSPHDFDKFDLSKIGTGEGAQVYGHGLYFAENPAVSGQGGQYWNQFLRRFGDEEYLAANKLKNAGFDRDAAAALAQKNVDEAASHLSAGTHPPWLQGGPFDEHTLRSINKNVLYQRQSELDLLRSDRPVGPRTYEVNINADPAHFLDWDKPLSQQPAQENILQAMKARGLPLDETGRPLWAKSDPTGEAIEASLAGAKNRRYASDVMHEAGIPGIKYLDQGSRNFNHGTTQWIAEQGGVDKARAIAQARYNDTIMKYGPAHRDARDWAATLKEIDNPPSSNYVVFNPSIVDIMKKYGIAAPIGGMGSLAAQDDYR